MPKSRFLGLFPGGFSSADPNGVIDGGGSAGDGAASSHVRYGDATKGSTLTNIVRFPTAVGTPDSSVISHNDADYLTQGSILTILEDGAYLVNVSTSANIAGFGMYIMMGTTPDNNIQTICGGETQPLAGTLCSFSNSRKFNFVAGDKIWVYCNTSLTDYGAFNYLHSISIVKLTKGQKGDTGAGAETVQTATQGSDGNTLTLTLSTTGDVFEVWGQITSQSASSATEIEFNGSAGSHSYRQHFSGGIDNGAGGYFPPGVVGSGVACIFHGTIKRIGELIIADLLVTLPTALSHSEVRKTVTGATNINALRVFSNQASGIGAGSFISARKVK